MGGFGIWKFYVAVLCRVVLVPALALQKIAVHVWVLVLRFYRSLMYAQQGWWWRCTAFSGFMGVVRRGIFDLKRPKRASS